MNGYQRKNSLKLPLDPAFAQGTCYLSEVLEAGTPTRELNLEILKSRLEVF